MLREGAEVEPEQNEHEPGLKYYEAMRESGTKMTDLQMLRAMRRTGIGPLKHLWRTFAVWSTVICVAFIVVLVRDSRTWYADKHQIWVEICILAGVCVFLIASCVVPYFWRRHRERRERLRADSQIETHNESSDARHPGS